MGVLMTIRRLLAGRSGAPGAGAHPPAAPAPAAPEDTRFAELVADALDELPDEFLRALERVPVVVSDGGATEGAYGLYRGAGVAHPEIAAQIVIFRDTLTRDFGADPPRMAAEIRRTVRHELGHHLGYGERGVSSLGL
ncbi:MAG TPA: metallopeptidase family protein [Baekduia sp.]|nr:metallopeptidase family protein [Baekduia sp.]